MDSKTKDSLDHIINFLGFIKEVKEKLPQLENLPKEVENLNKIKQSLLAEIKELEQKKRDLTSEFEKEHESKLNELKESSKNHSVQKEKLDSEWNRIKSEDSRIKSKELSLDAMVATYTKNSKEIENLKATLSEKLKKIGEVAVS